ncbi:hypothetical protein EXIGLDRAFT_759939 [Exidia glandulosa HHB12029]|uniref:Uncharacterized protein n=1 Tax=Exidia glandulosa HHB12029 TaxID=1314781 RepID=A0A165PNU3_EXIGL|nr:hypothetical protein EXIGLDRAFT_759939 [Exidia glandulosa HHB12029]
MLTPFERGFLDLLCVDVWKRGPSRRAANADPQRDSYAFDTGLSDCRSTSWFADDANGQGRWRCKKSASPSRDCRMETTAAVGTESTTRISSVTFDSTNRTYKLWRPETTASVWIQTNSGDTIAVLTENGQAWQWADENGDGPEAGQFDIKLVPGSMQPSGDDALVKLVHDGQECSLTNDTIDCTSTGSPAAVLRAKVKTDVVGETRWFLLGGHSQFSLEDLDQEKKLLAVTPDHGLGVNVYLTDAAAA